MLGRKRSPWRRVGAWFAASSVALAPPVFAAPGAGAEAGAAPEVGAGAEAGAGPDETPFAILEFRVLGNTQLPAQEIERAVYPMLGPDGTMARIEQARAALAEAYRSAGYGTVFVDVPEQTVEDGIVRLKVTEGRLDRVQVSGAKWSSARELRELVPSGTSGTTPNLKSLQKELVNVGRLSADRRVTPVLRAGRVPGAVDLELKVEDRVPVHAAVELNDRYTADTSELRGNATVSYDYLFGRPQSLSLQYQWSPQESGEISVWALSYVKRAADSPGAWVAYAVDSNSDVAALGTLTVLGKGNIYGLRYIRPSEDARAWLRAWSLGVDYKHFTEDVRLTSGDPARTPIDYTMWSASASLGRQWPDWSFESTTTLNLGLRGFGNTASEFAFKRFGGTPNFVYLRGDAALVRRLPANFTAALRTHWQYAPVPVIGNEQLGIGGVDSVRGYLEAESLVDRGIAGAFELGTPAWRLGGRGGEGGVALRALAFADAGLGALERPLPSQEHSFDLASYGLGLALERAPLIDASLYWARTLAPGDRTPDGDTRIHFDFRMGF